MAGPRAQVQERLAWLVATARSGAGGALLLTGEPGSGKSTLVQQVAARAAGATVLRAVGVPVERGLAHAGLHGLLRPLAGHTAALPALQRGALEVALGVAAGTAPGPLLLGASVLSLLAAATEQAPVLLLVDDAQWLDDASLSALAFAARRLDGERVGALFAARTLEVPAALDGVERCALPPLSAQEAVALLSASGVDPAVAEELAEATGGNALALVEQARDLDEAQRRGTAPLPAVTGLLFAEPVAQLSPGGLEAAALAALAGSLPAAVLHAARALLGRPDGDLGEAERQGLLVSAPDGVRWRHPLARAAVLDALPPERRRALAAALAEAAEQAGADPADVVELRVVAATGPDEALATSLEQAGAAAAAAGDHVRAGRCWQRAAEVGTDAARRGPRLLAAADAALHAGRLDVARRTYDDALRAGLDRRAEAQARTAQGRIEHLGGSPHLAADRFRLAAQTAPDRGAQVQASAEGVLAAMYAGAAELAADQAARAEAVHDPDDPAQRLLALHALGAAACVDGDLDRGRPLLLAALELARTSRVLDRRPDLLLWVLTVPLFAGGDPDAGADLVRPVLERVRLQGDLLWLPRLVRLWGSRHLQAGRAAAAYAAFEESVELSRAAGQTTQVVDGLAVLALLEAYRGERAACLAHTRELEQLLAVVDVPFLSGRAWQARGLLHLGLGEAAAAAAELAPARDVPHGVRFREQVRSDLVEALVLDGRSQEAAEAARTACARGRALVEPDDAQAVALLVAAAEAGGLEGARCRLLAGERLRRAGLRREAREHLRAASEVFARAGAEPWRRRADDGLRASGEALARAAAGSEPLTGAELRVAELVAQGRPTREVAALLFLSPKTVEFHLSKIYRKVGVRGRAELARALPAG